MKLINWISKKSAFLKGTIFGVIISFLGSFLIVLWNSNSKKTQKWIDSAFEAFEEE